MSRTFTPTDDRTILDGRAAGLSWDAIVARIGTVGKACQYRLARGLQVPDPKPVQEGRSKAQRDYDQPEDKERRDVLPAGADATWQATQRGTLLDGKGFR